MSCSGPSSTPSARGGTDHTTTKPPPQSTVPHRQPHCSLPPASSKASRSSPLHLRRFLHRQPRDHRRDGALPRASHPRHGSPPTACARHPLQAGRLNCSWARRAVSGMGTWGGGLSATLPPPSAATCDLALTASQAARHACQASLPSQGKRAGAEISDTHAMQHAAHMWLQRTHSFWVIACRGGSCRCRLERRQSV